ncbi:uroporphyrinogen decarboxylase [Sphingobium sp. YR768]|uniref:uroporphyrinogen decarboxylase n=1 Tax=Sphingobium sp. YR768 TaxID=1884365 RepID=UPI0008C7CEFB|nr:uroporphyrinogen decarboxylase [Sphingobium sp. YR768]SER49918.1 uroporphyrinogen decarboxylase [Sphingobium sp. YR768]
MCEDAPASPIEKPLLAVLKGDRPAASPQSPPMWLMRQAGRYLPEYRALRADKGGFLELVYDSTAAAEVTLQPLRRFGFDGAILFSDILIVPYAMGQDLWFEAGEGPRLAPILSETDLSALTPDFSRFDAVYETVRQVKAALSPEVTFLGFAGSPWTISTYMVAGQGSKDHGLARRMAYNEPERFAALIDAIVEATVIYLCGQIEAGVEAVQLFDSWAGSLSPLQFQRWVIEPNKRIVARLKALHPTIPVIGFPKGAGAKLADYAAQTGVDAVGVDETIDPYWANQALPTGMPVQGNLDPLALIAGGRAVEEAVDNIRAAFADRPHIFNLGHGILPDTPIAHVEALISYVRKEGVLA